MNNALNKHESKYFNTACLMDEALLCLLEKRDYAFITVKEICTKAGVNRSTFYLHYETMDDLLQETLAYTTKKFEEKFDPQTIDPMSDLVLIQPKYIMPYLQFLQEYRKVYMASMAQSKVFNTEKQFEKIYCQIILPVMQRLNVPQAEQKFVAAFYISGLHNLVFTWVKDGCKEDPAFICDLIMRFAVN